MKISHTLEQNMSEQMTNWKYLTGVGAEPGVSPERSPVLVRSGANAQMTPEDPERNDILRLEDGEQGDVQ